MAEAYVEYGVGMVWVEFDYNPELIEAIKEGVPIYGRTWDAGRRQWGFTPDWWPKAQEVLTEHVVLID